MKSNHSPDKSKILLFHESWWKIWSLVLISYPGELINWWVLATFRFACVMFLTAVLGCGLSRTGQISGQSKSSRKLEWNGLKDNKYKTSFEILLTRKLFCFIHVEKDLKVRGVKASQRYQHISGALGQKCEKEAKLHRTTSTGAHFS